MTEEELQKRLEQLQKEKSIVVNQITQLTANLHAYEGAIIECEHWLKINSEAKKK